MTLLRVESFGHYGPTTATTSPNKKFYEQFSRKWASAGTPLGGNPQGRINSGAPTGSGKIFQFQVITAVSPQQQDRLIFHPFYDAGDPTQTLIIGMRIKFTDFFETFTSFFRFFGKLSDAFDEPDLTLLLGSAGELMIRDAAGTYYDSLLHVESGVYNYLEIKFTRHASNGNIQLGVNGQYSTQVTGIPTNVGPAAAVAGHSNFMIQNNAYIAPGFGDFYLADDRGSINNDFLGDLLVVPSLPTEDVSVDFVPTSGVQNFEMVNDPQPAGPDEDTTVNSSQTLGAEDLFRGDGTGFLTGYRVLGIQGIARARKLDSGFAILRNVIGSGEPLVTAQGVNHYLSTVYRYHPHVFELNPDTAAPFTISEANDAVFGYHLADPEA